MTDERSNESLLPAESELALRPRDMRLDRREGLTIVWGDGRQSHYPLVYLRKNCPCATCRTEREAQAAMPATRSLTILPEGISRAAEFADARTVGRYAIQITWGDGHSTGIYDFRYLRAIDPSAQATQ